MASEPWCAYCQGNFCDLPPVFIRGYRDFPAHRDSDIDSNDCAYWLDWQEIGRWETGRGTQGERKWPDGRKWFPGPVYNRWLYDYGSEWQHDQQD